MHIWIICKNCINVQKCKTCPILTLICRFIAVDCAALTKPSSSAPLKFFVSTANSWMSTSLARSSYCRIFVVWMCRIWMRPFSSGKPVIKIILINNYYYKNYIKVYQLTTWYILYYKNFYLVTFKKKKKTLQMCSSVLTNLHLHL